MFGKVAVNTCFMTVVLFLVGCGMFSGANVAVEADEMVFLDSEFETEMNLDLATSVAVDVRLPQKGGYVLVGASFDPDLLRLDHFLEYTDDGETRARYIFTSIASGATDVLIKMKPASGGDVVIYKRVTITIS